MIIAEVISLLAVGVTIGELDHDHSAVGLLVLLGEIAGFVVLTWIISAKVLPRAMSLLQRLIDVPELSFGLLMGGLFLVVVGAEEMGLHGSLGALLFGASLSGLPNRLRHDIMPGMRSAAEGLFVPLFFARPAGTWISRLSAFRQPPSPPCCSSRCWESWQGASAPFWRGWTRRWS